ANSGVSTLIDDLLKNYDVDARPVSNWTESVHVFLQMSLIQVLSLDSIQQTMQTNIWVRAYWTDVNLRWDPQEYGGIDEITLTPSRIWTPDIVVYESYVYNVVLTPTTDHLDLFRVNVSPDGKLGWYMPLVLSTSCKLNLDQFPWDEQKCHLKYGSWSQPARRLDVFNFSSGIDLTGYQENGEWDLQGVDVRKHSQPSPFNADTYPFLVLTINLKRKASYYMINFVMPTGLVMLSMIMMHLLPDESGEKVS
ncbi:hypothetical protein CAPTEDRAFT_65079, partial [Capitella teleta]